MIVGVDVGVDDVFVGVAMPLMLLMLMWFNVMLMLGLMSIVLFKLLFAMVCFVDVVAAWDDWCW